MCKKCGDTIPHNWKSGTSHLGDHVKRRHPELVKPDEFAELSQVEAEEIIVELYINYNLPRRFVDDPAVTKLVTKRCVQFRKLSKDGLDDRVDKLKQFLTEDIIEKLSKIDTVMISADGWSSKALEKYLALYVVYLDKDAVLRKHCIGFDFFDESHTAVNVGGYVTRKLEEFNIGPAKVAAYVTDNAANMKASTRFIFPQPLPWLGCACHTFNLTLEVGTTSLEVKDLVDKVRDLAVHLHRNENANKAFQKCQKRAELPLTKLKRFCITRWNSLYFTLYSVLQNREALLLFWEKTTSFKMTQIEWVLAREMWKLCEAFAICIQTLEDEQNATISLVISMVQAIQRELEMTAVEDTQMLGEDQITAVTNRIRAVKSEMLEDFNRRWASFDDVYLVAAVLDPRTKDLNDLDEAQKEIAHQLVTRLYQDHVPLNRAPQSPPPSSFAPPKRKLQDMLVRPDNSQQSIDELERYLKLPQISNIEENAFKWWHNRKDQFPVLAPIALSRLSVPASSAVVERAFSKARTVDHEETNLSPNQRLTLSAFVPSI